MPIRWRLTLWFSLIIFAILGLSGSVLYSLLQRSLNNQVDDNLRVYSARVHGTLNPNEVPEPLEFHEIHDKLPPINEFASPGIYIQLIDRRGKVVVKSDNLGEHELPVNPTLIEQGFGGKTGIQTVAAGDGARVRIMVSPLFLRDQTLLLEVARSLSSVDSTMQRAGWAVLTSILLALALAIFSGVSLVRRALSPVAEITRTARSIEESSDLGRRLGYRGPPDEMGRLATTIDHMLEHLQKVFESQKHFVADASHELRTPLTVIRGNLDLLKRDMSEDDRRESLRALEAETKRMSQIVNDLLLLAEIESGPVKREESVSLPELVREELRRAQQLAGDRHLVLGRLEDLTVKGDSYRLKQLLSNLVDNALRYTPEGGTITLSLSREGEWARLEVIDTGIGIAPEHLPHIFERFYRVEQSRRRGGGTGLGLAIVKQVAEQHGGRVAVTSEPGKGSTFAVRLKL